MRDVVQKIISYVRQAVCLKTDNSYSYRLTTSKFPWYFAGWRGQISLLHSIYCVVMRPWRPSRHLRNTGFAQDMPATIEKYLCWYRAGMFDKAPSILLRPKKSRFSRR